MNASAAFAGGGIDFGLGALLLLMGTQWTNNSAELNVPYQASLIAKKGIDSGKEIEVFSDSQYGINCITVWAFNWQKKDWKRKRPEVDPGGWTENRS